MAQTSRFQVAGIHNDEKKAQVEALRQSLPGISGAEFVGKKIVEFKHCSATTTDQIKKALEGLKLRATLIRYTTA